MSIKIGINGMGRIGRMVVRSIFESQNKNLKIKHINNRSNSEVTCKLIKYDSIHGKFDADLKFDENHLIINKQKISFSQKPKIEEINWKKYDVDYVLECTGKFNSREKLKAHIKNGAKKVIVSAPCKNADKKNIKVIIEHVTAMPGQGVTSMFNFGQSFGILKGICSAMQLSVYFVRPAKWKKYFNLINSEKDASRTRAIEIFPYYSSHLSRKKDSNKADAILIASYFFETYKEEQ